MAISGLMLKANSLEILDQIKENDRGFKAFLKLLEKSFLRSRNLLTPLRKSKNGRTADESRLYQKQLPDKTYVSSLEKSDTDA